MLREGMHNYQAFYDINNKYIIFIESFDVRSHKLLTLTVNK